MMQCLFRGFIFGVALIACAVCFPAQANAAPCPMSYDVDYGYDAGTPTSPGNLPASCAPDVVVNGDGSSSPDQQGLYADAASGTYTAYSTGWLSVAGDPLATTVIVDAGTTAINLQYNKLTYRIKTNPATNIRRITQENMLGVLSDPSDLDVSGLLGKSPFTANFPTNSHPGYYRLMAPAQFTAYLNPFISNDQLYTIHTTSKSVLTYGSQFEYQCVNTNTFGESVSVTNLGDYTPCPEEYSTLSLAIDVRSAWNTVADTMLYADTGGGFTLRATSGDSIPTIPVGSKVYWNHKLRVLGTTKEEYTIDPLNRVRTGGGAGFDATSSAGSWTFGGGGVTYISPHTDGTYDPEMTKDVTGISTAASPYTVAFADIGKTLCENMNWKPSARSGGTLDPTVKYSTATCFKVVGPPYELMPSVTVSPATVGLGGSTQFSYNVSNNTVYDSNNTNWTVRQIVISPSATLPGGFLGSHTGISLTCAMYTIVAGVTCMDMPSGAMVFPGGSTPPRSAEDVAVGALLPGTRICRSLMIDSYDQSASPHQKESSLSCALVGTSPYLTIVGGNLWAGGSTTSPYTGIAKVTASPPSTFGSFGDYGVFATGVISYFGSAGQFGKAPSTSGMVDGTRLTFANAPNLGSYSSSHKITNMMSSIPVGAPIGNGPVPATGVYVETSSNITLSATNMAPGTHVTIYVPNNTVRIDGNITYDTTSTSVSSFAQVPSLTIVAKRIEISGTVAEIAGNFYASSSFVTCYQGPELPGISAAITSAPGAACNNRLDIHGAVTVANQAVNSLVFNRSSGGSSDGNPSEVIQMRPEVFLTAYELSAQSGDMIMTTVQETSLPPRY